MNDPIRVSYALSHHTGHTAVTIGLVEWRAMVRPDSEPTRLVRAPGPLSQVQEEAVVVAIAASGNCPAAGVDIVRAAPEDHPYIYNVDHYTVVERLSESPDYLRILAKAGVQDSQKLRNVLDSWVFFIGPERVPETHWATTVPEYIRNAKSITELVDPANPRLRSGR